MITSLCSVAAPRSSDREAAKCDGDQTEYKRDDRPGPAAAGSDTTGSDHTKSADSGRDQSRDDRTHSSGRTKETRESESAENDTDQADHRR
jgi:hypothetical protein